MKTKFGIVGCGFLGNIVADAWKKGLLEKLGLDVSIEDSAKKKYKQ